MANPMYRQIAEALRGEIEAGELAPGGRLPTGSVVVSRHERRFLDGTPWSMLTSFYPMDFVVRGAVRLTTPEDIEEGTVRYLADTLGIHQMGYRDWLLVRTPDNNEADFFKLPPDGRTSIVEI